MKTIAFHASDPRNKRQLALLARQKSAPSNLVVVDAGPDPANPGVLLVSLGEPGGSQAVAAGGSEGAGAAKSVPGARGPRILCVHGVGHHEGDPANEGAWRAAIAAALEAAGGGAGAELEFVAYDEFFAAQPLGPVQVLEAVWKLGRSGMVNGISDLFGTRSRGDVSSMLRWTAGMVVQWAENDGLRERCRKVVAEHVRRFDPDVILAHSLGSLLCYDTFSRPETSGLLKGRVLVTFGSQIGNAFVRSSVAFNGRIEPLPAARHWFHAFNPHDDAFTARLRIEAPNFTQFDAKFDLPGMLDHDAGRYLSHKATVDFVWRTVAGTGRGGVVGKGRKAGSAAVVPTLNLRMPKPEKRALLVGINDYPNPGMRLEGCVNDVFLTSGMLQELGFKSENVRILLNERATASAILERLEWLLDGSQAGHERVFYYSGHGAQLPGYGVRETVDECDECLVPFDFDWSLANAVTDNQFHDLYSQLPYDARFLTVFDCCHSGGLARDGGMRVRGINPPDDIRHRLLKWENGTWVPRWEPPREETKAEAKTAKKESMTRDAFLKRMGRASALRSTTGKGFKEACREQGHKGPYMPVILEACQENQFAYEYRHGATPHGAFTWLLVETLRKGLKKGQSWTDLVSRVNAGLEALRYPQSALVEGPSSVVSSPIGWFRR